MSKMYQFAKPLLAQGLGKKKKKVSLRGNWFEERQMPKQIHSLTDIAYEKYFHKKNCSG